MLNLVQRSFGINIRVMQLCGLYPLTKNEYFNISHKYLAYCLLVIPVPLLEFLNMILQENVSFLQFADNAFLLAELAGFIPKLWPFVRHSDRVKKCIHNFDSRDSAPAGRIKEIYEDCVTVCRRVTRINLVWSSSALLTWACRPISWDNHIFPTDVWLPFDPKAVSALWSTLVYVYLVMSVGYGSFSSGVIDPLMGGLAYHGTTQLKILKYNLENLHKYAGRSSCKSEKWKLLHQGIKECVIHHVDIINFVKEYEECFSQVAFSQFVAAVVVICVSCLQLTIVEIFSLNFLAMMSYLIAMFAEIYIYCHYGTSLYEESKSIADAVYLGYWYDFDISSRKSLIILMERAKRPLIVKSGKILDMSFITLTMILRRSYSLLAILGNYYLNLS